MDKEFLKEMKERMNNQDNACTAHPIYTVKTKRQIVVHEEYGDADYKEWFIDMGGEPTTFIHDDGGEHIREIHDALKEYLFEDGEEESDEKFPYTYETFAEKLDEETWFGSEWNPKDIEDVRIGCVSIKEIDIFETACFTRKGAEEYIERHKHNLYKPFIYVHSLYGNPEMREIRKLLKGDDKDN